METFKDMSNNKTNSFLNININFSIIGISLFTLIFSTLKSFIFSSSIEWLILLLFSLVILVFSTLVVNKKGITLSIIDIMWIIFFMIFVVNIAFNNILTPVTMIDIFTYASGILFLLLVKVNISYYDSSLKLIKLLGVIYAFSAIFQYLYTDIYLSYVLPLFSSVEKTSILALLKGNTYTGLTDQTAYTAGYIVSGMGVFIFSNWKKKSLFKIISIFFLAILFIGLLLTAKRAHLIFMIAAVLITFIFSINSKDFFNKVIKMILGGLALVLLLVFLFNAIKFNEESPIVNFVHQLDDTMNGIIEGKDVTTGRSTLYSHSWELFRENPITGIGWREFFKNSLGLINSDVHSHPHNIYLQLLTELGIIGFLLFVIPVSYLYYQTIRLLRMLSVKDSSLQLRKWKYGVQFSFYSQTFFILYGITGNLLTDLNFLLMYFFSCSISMSALVKNDN